MGKLIQDKNFLSWHYPFNQSSLSGRITCVRCWSLCRTPSSPPSPPTQSSRILSRYLCTTFPRCASTFAESVVHYIKRALGLWVQIIKVQRRLVQKNIAQCLSNKKTLKKHIYNLILQCPSGCADDALYEGLFSTQPPSLWGTLSCLLAQIFMLFSFALRIWHFLQYIYFFPVFRLYGKTCTHLYI